MPHPQGRRAKAQKAKRAQNRRLVTADERRSADADRAKKAELRDQFALDRRRRRAIRRLRSWSLGALALVAVGVVIWWAFRPLPEVEAVERPRDLGRGHITGATYDDATPTSGAHSAASPPCGISPTPLEPDLAVHALEHGVVVLWYRADQPDVGAELLSAIDEWDSHIIISPSTAIESAIVATAWNRKKTYAEAGEVADFVAIYRKRGPESVACDL